MGVAMREDGGTVGVFSPKKVQGLSLCHALAKQLLNLLNDQTKLTQTLKHISLSDASSGEPQRGPTDVRVSALLHQRRHNQVKSSISSI